MSARLLVIDDDPVAAALVAEVARQVGFSVIVTHDFSAFTSNYSDELAVIVVDLMMPGVDGIQILRYLAGRKSPCSVLLVSGVERRLLETARSLASARGLQVLGSLAKPFPVAELKQLLGERLRTELVAKQPASPFLPDAAELSGALARDELHVLFQPQVEMRTRRVVGVEAVVRWQHPELGLLGADTLVGLAERSGLIDEVTKRVITTSLARAAEWQAQGASLRTAFNVSPRCLSDLELPERLQEATSGHGLDPGRIVVEVTESWIAADFPTALDILTRLRLKGFQLAIDDFGTGYATLERLSHIPFTELKLDQIFVQAALRDADRRSIVESSIQLGHALDLTVVAEGIEREEEWDLLASLKCDMAQGFLIAPPLEAEELLGWIERGAAERAIESPSKASPS